MSYKIDMSSNDLDKQINLMRHYPEVMERHFKAVMKLDVDALYNKIKPNIPKKTGRAAKKFKRSVSGKGVNLQGRVGWWGKDQPYYINMQEYGAEGHDILPKDKTVSRVGKFLSGRTFSKVLYFNGRFSTKARHPGFAARGFMAAGFSAMKPRIDADMARASEATLKEMEVR